MHNIPGYYIKSSLGEGGMAQVFLATQTSLDRSVAIKVLDAKLNSDPVVQQQFFQESRIIAQLHHPNIIQVFDQGTTDKGLPFFVMPYVKSVSLDAVVKREDISLTRKLDIFLQICKALAYAHRNGIIHRDIKPANVLVDYEGHVRLVDFGIAGYFNANQPVEETTEVVMGTAAYMAPEQRAGSANTSHLSDIYSLGVLMHIVTFGILPFQKTENTSDIDKTGLIPYLKEIIGLCLESSPEKRPESAENLRQRLLLLAQGKHLRSNRWKKEFKQENLPPDYKLLDVIKENPFGVTYLVSDQNKKRLLIVKKQNHEHLGKAPASAKFLMDNPHPNIVQIYGTGSNERVFIIVGEYMTSGSLQDRFAKLKVKDYADGKNKSFVQFLSSFAWQLCCALEHAHSADLIHGNLRPGNILFTKHQQIKVSDFGFPLHTYGKESAWYHAAEEPASKLSDIYSAGVILFEMATGEKPTDKLWGFGNRAKLKLYPAPIKKTILKMIHRNPGKRLNDLSVAKQAFYLDQDDINTQVSR